MDFVTELHPAFQDVEVDPCGVVLTRQRRERDELPHFFFIRPVPGEFSSRHDAAIDHGVLIYLIRLHVNEIKAEMVRALSRDNLHEIRTSASQ